MLKIALLLLCTPIFIICSSVLLVLIVFETIFGKIPIFGDVVAAISLPFYLVVYPVFAIYEHYVLKYIDYRGDIENDFILLRSNIFQFKEISLSDVECLETNFEPGMKSYRLVLANGKYQYLSRISNLNEFVKKVKQTEIKYVDHSDF